MKKTTIFFQVILGLLVFSRLHAQYTVAATSGTYTDLVNPTIIASGTTFKTNYSIDIPGSFTAFNKSYGLDKASTGGEGTNIFPNPGIILAESSTESTNIEINAFGNCILTGIDASSSISYLVTGDTKTGMVKFQWKNMGLKNSGDATDFINIQLWLDRGNKTATVIMGPNKITGSGAFGTHGNPSIGLDEYDRMFNNILASGYTQGNPASPVMVTTTRGFADPSPVLAGIPAAGMIYTFQFAHVHTSGIDIINNTRLNTDVFPNPANNTFALKYEIAEKSDVNISMIDMSGRQISILSDEIKPAGIYNLTIQTGPLKPGIYFLVVRSGTDSRTEKVVIFH